MYYTLSTYFQILILLQYSGDMKQCILQFSWFNDKTFKSADVVHMMKKHLGKLQCPVIIVKKIIQSDKGGWDVVTQRHDKSIHSWWKMKIHWHVPWVYIELSISGVLSVQKNIADILADCLHHLFLQKYIYTVHMRAGTHTHTNAGVTFCLGSHLA